MKKDRSRLQGFLWELIGPSLNIQSLMSFLCKGRLSLAGKKIKKKRSLSPSHLGC